MHMLRHQPSHLAASSCRSTIYNMCTQKPPHDYSEALYNRYRDVFCYYINESVRRSLSCSATLDLQPSSTVAMHFELFTPWWRDHAFHVQVLPSLRDQRDEKLLRELHRRWDNHNVMTRWLSRFFNYLDRCASGRPHVAATLSTRVLFADCIGRNSCLVLESAGYPTFPNLNAGITSLGIRWRRSKMWACSASKVQGSRKHGACMSAFACNSCQQSHEP